MNDLHQLLSKQDAIICLEIIHKSTLCSNQEDFFCLMHRLKKLIYYEYDVCALAVNKADGTRDSLDLLNISYPDELLSIYNTREWNKSDPLHKENFSQFKLQYWADTFMKYGTPRDMASIFYDFNVKEGYAHGVRNMAGDRGSIFCFAAKKMKKERRTEMILNLIIPHLHHTLTCVVNRNVDKMKDAISVREREILKWIMQGKSTWDISTILKISERTVKFHVKNFMKKLDAVNRTHAVAIALQKGLIELD